jgi:hypothetical protein
MATMSPRGRAMVWLVLESLYMPNHFRLHSEAKWLVLNRHERHAWNIVKRCETRDEANRVLDEARAGCGEGQEGHTNVARDPWWHLLRHRGSPSRTPWLPRDLLKTPAIRNWQGGFSSVRIIHGFTKWYSTVSDTPVERPNVTLLTPL